MVNETKESRAMPRRSRDFDKEDEEIAVDLVANANGHAHLIPQDEDQKKETDKKEEE